jgi:DNA adenine methylase
MKTPIVYYGGKQHLAEKIISLIPEHKTYVEPFAGGLAVFFAKKPSCGETINDTSGELINFYTVLKHNYAELQRLVEVSLHSRELYNEAMRIHRSGDTCDPVRRAWALWYLSNTSFSAKLCGGYGYDKKGSKTSKALAGKRRNFTEKYAERLELVQIECDDALAVIKRMDTPDTFFYCDPPYIDTNQGHYGGYTNEDYERLLDTLSRIRGRFLLSSYPNEPLRTFAAKHGWNTKEIIVKLCVGKSAAKENRTETLTANYPLEEIGPLFSGEGTA